MRIILKDCYVGERGTIKGYTFWNGRLCRGEEFYKIFGSINDEIKLIETVKCLSGSFVFSISMGESLYVVTDIIRSIPAFYGVIDGELVISDKYDVFEANNRMICRDAVDELLATTYITGSDTLFEGIYQMQAARVYCFKNEELISIKRYYCESTPEQSELNVSLKRMVEAYDKAIDRLIIYLNGRQAVIPLSGGLDGRFIVSCLKKKGYHNIFSFTYGREEKGEVLASKTIAHTLGVQWCCVPYESKAMQRLFYSNEFEQMAAVAGNITAVPMIQDWYALHYLKEKKIINSNAVIIPGHAVSNMAELSPKQLEEKEFFCAKEIVDIIYDTNYIFWNVNNEKVKNGLIRKLQKRIPDNACYTALEAYDFVKDFCYEERQAKLIANAVRVYEYFGYDWYMPFWDTMVVNSWHLTSKEHSDGRKIYYLAINQLCPGCVDIIRPVGHENEFGIEITRGVLRKFADKCFPSLYGTLRSLRHQKDNLNLWGYLSLKDRLYGARKNQKFADAMWVYLFYMRVYKKGKKKNEAQDN